jgi:hypothetical protein
MSWKDCIAPREERGTQDMGTCPWSRVLRSSYICGTNRWIYQQIFNDSLTMITLTVLRSRLRESKLKGTTNARLRHSIYVGSQSRITETNLQEASKMTRAR